MYNQVKDSGKRQTFPTGSVRDIQSGKGRFDLISPIVKDRLAKHHENGAVKYGDRNWEKGQPLGRYVDSAMRHLNKYLEGHRDEDHLSAVIWNVGALIHTEEMIRRGALPATLNDLPDYLPKPQEPAPNPVKIPEGPGKVIESGPGWFWCLMNDTDYDLQDAERKKCWMRWDDMWSRYGEMGNETDFGWYARADDLDSALKKAGLTR